MKKSLFFVIVLSFFCVGCVSQPKPMYYWGTYSKTLYNLKKTPSEENIAIHLENLHKIVDNSIKNDTRIPPGVYAELGYMNLHQNHNAEAKKYFKLEIDTYPESKILMDKLITNVEI